jgi:hypothetical protein
MNSLGNNSFLRGGKVMLNRTVRILTITCGVAVAVLSLPALSEAGIFDCWHGCAKPTYAAAPVVAAPVVAAPGCSTCATQTCGYMPTVVYRALYQPAVVTAYQPVYQPVYQTAYQPVYQPAAPCNTCTSYAVTTYRPPFAWAYQGSLVPYTTYRPVYAAMPVVAYSGCNSCASYTPAPACSSCASGGCGTVTYQAPAATGCSSCAAGATILTPSPAAETPPAVNAAPPQTFKNEAEKPAIGPEATPTPIPDAHFNSMPSPLLPDPKDRTASRSNYSTVRLVASPVQAEPARDNDGWQPARD